MNLNLSLTFHGAIGTTTGSNHLLTIDDKPILFDCGLYQGRRREAAERNRNFMHFQPRGLHSVLLSHAHIDHSGNLPNLVKQGFAGRIYCTPATLDLCKIMLLDSAHIQEKDALWLNKKRARNGHDRRNDNHGHNNDNGEIIPLYTQEDVERTLPLFQGNPYHTPFNVLRDLKATFYDAGHILGSASVILDIQRGDHSFRLAYSGDIGRVGLPILSDPEIPHDVDWLIMETTYGARTHDPIGEAKEELRATVVRVAARGGKIIVPSFSVERTQEIVYYLNELSNEGKLPPIPVYIDSPLAVNVTDIFRLHPDCYDREMLAHLHSDNDPFSFPRLSYIRNVEDSKKLNFLTTPAIIISASGMCEAGRILHHLRNSIDNPKNCVMFVGYQAQNTLGRKIVERTPEVKILGEMHRLRAEVVTLNTMSGHADKDDLFNYARTVANNSKNLKGIFLVHGEDDGRMAFGERLRDELNLPVVAPEAGERILLSNEKEKIKLVAATK